MNIDRPTDDSPGDDAPFRTLLELGRVQADRPTARLRARVAQDDGAAWIEAAVAHAPDGREIDAVAMLVDGSASLDDLRAQHRLAKQAFHDSSDPDGRDRGMLWYLLLIAAAAAHHDSCLSSQARATVVDALLDVAPDLPDPWGDLVARGGMALD